MKRKKQAKEIKNQIKRVLKNNPDLKEALRVFDISYEQYQKTLQGNYSHYTSTSTSPTRVEFGAKNK